MDRWESEIDKSIREFLNGGVTSNLEGAGKPLRLSDDANVPDDMRVAYKIMAEHEILPEWIELGKELEKRAENLHRAIKQHVTAYKEGLQRAKSPTEQDHIVAVWESAQKKLAEQVKEYNDKVLTYNLKVPVTVKQLLMFNLKREIDNLL